MKNKKKKGIEFFYKRDGKSMHLGIGDSKEYERWNNSNNYLAPTSDDIVERVTIKGRRREDLDGLTSGKLKEIILNPFSRKQINISYSWGDEECPVVVPEGEDTYEFMLNLALKELRIELMEHLGEGTASIEAEENYINLTYCDGQICYYKVADLEEGEE